MQAAGSRHSAGEPSNGSVAVHGFNAAAVAAQLAAAQSPGHQTAHHRRHSLGWRVASFVPALVVAALIVTFSTDRFTACDSSVSVTAALLDASGVNDDRAWFVVYTSLRKACHAGAFFLLGLSCFAFEPHRGHRWISGFALCGLLAIGTELLQVYSLTRQGRVLDVAIDVFSFVPGVLLVPFLTGSALRLHNTGAHVISAVHALHHFAAVHAGKRPRHGLPRL